MLQPFVVLILYAWVLVVAILFSQFPPQKALLIAVVGSTLFLPYPLFEGPAGLTIAKITMTSLGCCLGTVLFHSERLAAFSPSPLDLPFFILTFSVFPSQLANNLSPLSPVANHILTWGVPYFMGRIYLNDLKGLKQLSVAILVGGLLYAPFCLWESRMSPNLHTQIYGAFEFIDWTQSIRLGGFRPSVFMGHGLPVGMWMAAAAVVGVWFWQFKVFKKFWNQPMQLLAIGLFITFILVRSTGAYIYFVAGAGIILIALKLRTALPLILLILYVVGYVIVGATGYYHNLPFAKLNIQISYTERAVEIQGERGQSYWYRIRNEKIISEHARKKLWTGWGGSGGNFTVDPKTGQLTVPDSLWVLTYSVLGLPGLVATVLIFILPAFAFIMRYPAKLWTHPKLAPVAVLPLINVLYMWDCTLNSFPNAVFLVISGGLVGLLAGPQESLATTKPVLTATVSMGKQLPPATSAAKKRVLAAKRASMFK